MYVVGNIIEQGLLHETLHSHEINPARATASGKPDSYSASSTLSLIEDADRASAHLHFPAF